MLTCAESVGLVLAIDSNGVVTPYNLGLGSPEDVRLIPSGQHLFCLDHLVPGSVLKVTADNFAGFAGDILLVHEGIICGTSGMDIVHWEGGRFVVRHIPIDTALEHVTFAPIGL